MVEESVKMVKIYADDVLDITYVSGGGIDSGPFKKAKTRGKVTKPSPLFSSGVFS